MSQHPKSAVSLLPILHSLTTSSTNVKKCSIPIQKTTENKLQDFYEQLQQFSENVSSGSRRDRLGEFQGKQEQGQEQGHEQEQEQEEEIRMLEEEIGKVRKFVEQSQGLIHEEKARRLLLQELINQIATQTKNDAKLLKNSRTDYQKHKINQVYYDQEHSDQSGYLEDSSSGAETQQLMEQFHNIQQHMATILKMQQPSSENPKKSSQNVVQNKDPNIIKIDKQQKYAPYQNNNLHSIKNKNCGLAPWIKQHTHKQPEMQKIQDESMTKTKRKQIFPAKNTANQDSFINITQQRKKIRKQIEDEQRVDKKLQINSHKNIGSQIEEQYSRFKKIKQNTNYQPSSSYIPDLDYNSKNKLQELDLYLTRPLQRHSACAQILSKQTKKYNQMLKKTRRQHRKCDNIIRQIRLQAYK